MNSEKWNYDNSKYFEGKNKSLNEPWSTVPQIGMNLVDSETAFAPSASTVKFQRTPRKCGLMAHEHKAALIQFRTEFAFLNQFQFTPYTNPRFLIL